MCKYNMKHPTPMALSRQISVLHVLPPIPILPPFYTPFHLQSWTPNLVVLAVGVASVSNQLHSTNHLAHCEESQELGEDNSSGYNLCSVDISDGL